MKLLRDRGVALGRAALMGYLLGLVVTLSAVILVGAGAYLLGLGSFSLRIGSAPLIDFWRSGQSWSFNSGWGLGVLTPLGAVIGLGVELSRSSRQTA
ncbi:MAG TPA: hypothetical protein VF375_11210 [Candidatus Limnocylindrales bacterium]